MIEEMIAVTIAEMTAMTAVMMIGEATGGKE